MHKFRPTGMPDTSIQQLLLLFTEREKVLKSLSSFKKTSENRDFVLKDVFHTVEAVNKSIITKLNRALKSIEEKMQVIIASDAKLHQQHELITSIPGIGMQTAI